MGSNGIISANAFGQEGCVGGTCVADDETAHSAFKISCETIIFVPLRPDLARRIMAAATASVGIGVYCRIRPMAPVAPRTNAFITTKIMEMAEKMSILAV